MATLNISQDISSSDGKVATRLTASSAIVSFSPLWQLLEEILANSTLQESYPWLHANYQIEYVLPRILDHLAPPSSTPTSQQHTYRTIQLCVPVARLPVELTASEMMIRDTLLPIVVISAVNYMQLKTQHTNTQLQRKAERILFGITAPAGAGKTTLTQLLIVVGAAWHSVMIQLAHDVELSATLKPTRYGSIFNNEPTHSPFLALSMDAYHLPNAELDQRNLRRDKGRIDTIDAAAFATDLLQLQCDGGVVMLPEYDRATSHDPIADAIRADAFHAIVFVEGLYLCAASPTVIGSDDKCSTESVTVEEGSLQLAALSPAQISAWSSVRRALDMAVALFVPMEICRERTVSRKVAASGVTREYSEAYYDRVDKPIFLALQHDGLRDISRGGPNIVLHMDNSGMVSRCTLRVLFDAARVHSNTPTHHQQPISLIDTVATTIVSSKSHNRDSNVTAEAENKKSTLVVIGLNPCVQRTLLYEKPNPLPGTAVQRTPPHTVVTTSQEASDGSTAVGWRRGGVNRASRGIDTIGGKGAHCALAMVREAAIRQAAVDSQSSAPINISNNLLSVQLIQYLGGATGAIAATHLNTVINAAQHRTLPVSFHAQNIAVPSPTRTCVTVLDRVAKDMTEFIEPAQPVTPSHADAVVASVQQAVSTGDVAAIALMGTVPPGAERVYERICSTVSEPFVLLDVAARANAVLQAGGVALLKINAEELQQVANEVCGAERVAKLVERNQFNATPNVTTTIRTAEMLLRTLRAPADPLFLSADKQQQQNILRRLLRAIAVTDGADPAVLVEVFSSPSSTQAPPSAWPLLTHVLTLPRSDPAVIQNPIGCGDTVAGVTLLHHVKKSSLVHAFARGLAAASASAQTLTGADWDEATAADILNGLHVQSEISFDR